MPTPAAPPVDEFQAIPDPFDQLAALNRLAEVMGYRFPPEHAALRRALVHQVRAMRTPDGKPYSLAKIARKINKSKTRVWQMLTAAGNDARSDATTPDLAPSCAPLAVPPSSHAKTAAGGDLQTVAEVSR